MNGISIPEKKKHKTLNREFLVVSKKGVEIWDNSNENWWSY